MSVLAIDPGSSQSAWLLLDVTIPRGFGILPNDDLLARLQSPDPWPAAVGLVVIEKVEGYGMRVGREVFETVFWSGRFAEAASRWSRVDRIGRMAVKRFLCGKNNAGDSQVRTALLERYGGGQRANGPGRPLFGVTKDVWSALAVAVTAEDRLL